LNNLKINYGTKDPKIEAFAQKMINDQKAEIKMMQDWLKKKEKK
jgi:uncharacterized protein (DUF305 family)